MAPWNLAFANDEERVVAALGFLDPVNISQRVDGRMGWTIRQQWRERPELDLK